METGAALLPCLNRVFPHIVDHDGEGVLVYGSRSTIYFVNLRVCPPVILEDKVISYAHRPRVTSVSLCKNKNIELLASTGEDSLLKIWNFTSRESVAEIKVFEFCRVVEWLSGSSNTVTYAIDSGGIMKWNFKDNLFRKLGTKSANAVIILVSNPKSPELLAAGHTNGTVSILDVIKETLLHSFGSHNNEILSLSWSPVSPNILLSASKDQTLRLWKIGEDGSLFTYHSSQNKYVDKKHKHEDKKYQKYFAICHPENEDEIIVSSLRGEIGSVSFKENAKFVPYVTRGGESVSHSIGMCVWRAEYQGKQRNILISADAFKISFWDISERKFLYKIFLLLGDILDLRASTVNPNLLAICASDGFMKFWNLASETSELDISTVYVYAKTKIMTAAWHPVDENIVAYGTNEGRVGIIDIFKKRSMYWFETQHKDAVYALSWGPCLKSAKLEDSDKNKYFLYSCGAGTIYINKINEERARALDFDDLVDIPSDMEKSEKSYTEVCWKSDYSYLAVCNRKGFVDLYNVKAVLLVRFDVKAKPIECLQWHPDCTYASPSGSPLNFWFAMSGIDHDIHIFDVKEISGKETGLKIDRSTKKLTGHAKSVCSLCWSPHTEGLLASASRDGSVQVWNVLSSLPIANYQCHRDNVFAVHWSPLDPDVLLSGGQDSVVRIWKISQQTAIVPPEKSLVRKKRRIRKTHEELGKWANDISESLKNVSIIGAAAAEPSAAIIETEEIETISEVKKTPLETEASSQAAEEKNVTEFKRKQKYSYGKSSLFSIEGISSDSKKNDIRNVIKLVDVLTDSSSDNSRCTTDFLMEEIMDSGTESNVMNLGLFTDQLTALKMIEIQSERLKNLPTGNTMNCITALSLMITDTKKLLENAAENGSLSDFLLCLAPSVSYAFWIDMCCSYAKQLSGQGQYAKASIILIGCGKVCEAIDLLAEKVNAVNALAVAKAYLPESDPIIRKLLFKCAKRFRYQHYYALEAMCYLAAKEFKQAAKTLYNTTEPAYIIGAAYVCKKFCDKENEDLYNFLCLEKSLVKREWPVFKKLVKQEPRMKVYSAVVCVHENLCSHLKQIDNQELMIMNSSVHAAKNRKIKFWEGTTSLDFKKSLVGYIYDELMKEKILPPEGFSLQDMHEALLDMADKRKNSEVPSEAHISVAMFSTQFIILLLLGNTDLAEKYFLKIFEACCNVPSLLSGVCSLFLPFDLYWCGDTNTLLCEVKQLDDRDESFILQYKNICESFSKKISGYANSLDLLIVKEDFSNLPNVILKVKETLQCKKFEDILLPYFALNLIAVLSKLVVKKEYKFHHFENDNHLELAADVLVKGENTHKESSHVCLQNKHEIKSVISAETVCGIVETEVNDELEKLINIALKEADEKSKFLREAQDDECRVQEIDADINNMHQYILCNSDFEDSSESIKQSFLCDEKEQKKESNVINSQAFISTNLEISEENLTNEIIDQCLELKNDRKLQNNDLSHSLNDKEEANVNETESLYQLDGHNQENIQMAEFQKSGYDFCHLEENCMDLNEIAQNELSVNRLHSTNTSDSILSKGENELKEEYLENIPTVVNASEQIINQDNELNCLSGEQQNLEEKLVPISSEQNFKGTEFISLLKLLTSMICKDEYGLMHFIREQCTKLKLSVVSEEQNQNLDENSSNKLPDAVENITSVEGMPLNHYPLTPHSLTEPLTLETEDQHQLPLDSKNNLFENVDNNVNSLNSNISESKHDASINLNNSNSSEAHYEEIFNLLIAKSKGTICPNTFYIVQEVIKICCDVVQKVQHEDVENSANAWMDELKMWSEKFCIKWKSTWNV